MNELAGQLLVQSGLGLIFFLMAVTALRGTSGGWFDVRRSRRSGERVRKADWSALPTAVRGWYFSIPVLLGYAVLTLLGALVVIYATGTNSFLDYFRAS